MSKRKTVLKFSIAALLLGGSSTVAVLYFPYVALAIKFGIVISNPSYGLANKERSRNRGLFGFHGVGNEGRKNMDQKIYW